MKKIPHMNRLAILLLPLAILLLVGCGVAPLTPSFSHQGRLLDDSGNPVPDGNYEVRYNIFQTASGGTAVYTDTQTINVENGLFTTSLGLTENITPTIFARPTWLEVTIDGETLTPRQRLLGSPYAFSLVSGSVVRGAELLDRSFLGQDDTGAVMTVWNYGVSAQSGHALLAINQAAPSGVDRDRVAAFQAIAAGGTNNNGADPDTGAYGAIVRSESYRGLYAQGAGAPGSSYLAAVFDSPAGIAIVGGGGCTGCALLYNAQNVGDVPIEAGDFVAIEGVTQDAELNVPVMQVRKATAASQAVIGVASEALSRAPVTVYNGVLTGGYDSAGDTAAPGGYLSVVVQGLVQAKAASGAGVAPGDMVTLSAEGVLSGDTGVARALSSVDENGFVWVMVGSQ